MRQARAWMTGEFWPATARSFCRGGKPCGPHNAWLRSAHLLGDGCGDVLHGAVSAELFCDCNAEGFFMRPSFAHSEGSGEESDS